MAILVKPPALKPINTVQPSFKMQGRDMDSHKDTVMEDVERILERVQSQGNQLYRSVTSDWFNFNPQWVQTFLENPEDPRLLPEIQLPTEYVGQSSSQIPPPGPFAVSDSPSMRFPAIPEPVYIEAHRYNVLESAMSQSQLSHSSSPGGRSSEFRAESRSMPLQMGHIESPTVETPPQRILNRNASLRSHQASPVQSSRPASAPSVGTSSDSRNPSLGLPEGIISLADKAAALGAPSKTQGARATRSPSQTALEADDLPAKQGSESLRSLNEAAKNMAIKEEPGAVAERKGPGRRKRTAPFTIETEARELKTVTPEEFRKLRRRITNRLSARKMRLKHSEEKSKIQAAHKTMRATLDQRDQALQDLQRENQALHRDNQHLRQTAHSLREQSRALEFSYAQLQAERNEALGRVQELTHRNEDLQDYLDTRNSQAMQSQDLQMHGLALSASQMRSMGSPLGSAHASPRAGPSLSPHAAQISREMLHMSQSPMQMEPLAHQGHIHLDIASQGETMHLMGGSNFPGSQEMPLPGSITGQHSAPAQIYSRGHSREASFGHFLTQQTSPRSLDHQPSFPSRIQGLGDIPDPAIDLREGIIGEPQMLIPDEELQHFSPPIFPRFPPNQDPRFPSNQDPRFQK